MQTKKMSFANIQGKLSRTEMKNIMAGSGTGCTKCKVNSDCGVNGLCVDWTGSGGPCGVGKYCF